MNELPISRRVGTLPGDLLDAASVARATGVSETRILELAQSCMIPHWRIDGGPPLFKIAETKRWISDNLAERIEGASLPFELRITVQPPLATTAPLALRAIANLREIPIRDCVGVYFLVRDDVVVYVGKSKRVFDRIVEHQRDKKPFSRVYFLAAPAEMLDDIEGALIRCLEPELNGRRAWNNGDKNGVVVIARGHSDHDERILRSIGFEIEEHAVGLSR